MANEIRVRQNFIGGLVDTADLASGGTTLNSAGLAAIASTIGSTQHMAITLDPDGIYGAPEIAYITAYTAGAASATILRAQEGTTARQHLIDTPWVHGPTVQDLIAPNLISRQVLAANTASVTISNIPQTYENLRLAVVGRSDRAGVADDIVVVQFNGDTAANYKTQYFTDFTSGTWSGDNTASTYIQAGELTAATATANAPGYAEARIFAYARTTWHKVLRGLGGNASITPGASVGGIDLYTGLWASTAAITSILVKPQVGSNLLAGTIISLYGEG